MFFDPQFHGHVSNVHIVLISVERFICFVAGIEITLRLTCLWINDYLDHVSRDDNSLFAKPELSMQAVKRRVDSFHRVKSVRIDANAQRTLSVDIVCRVWLEIRENRFRQTAYSYFFFQIRKQCR